MIWEEKITELNDYGIAFEIKRGYYHVSIEYKDSWNVLKPNNECIYVEKRDGIWHYIGQLTQISVEDIFRAIDETIEYNKDAERKLALFKEKVSELQEVFSNESYDVLKTIEFKLAKKKKKTEKEETEEPKKKAAKKKTTVKKEKPSKKKSVSEVEKEDTDLEKHIVEKYVDGQDVQKTMEESSYGDAEEIVTMDNNSFFEELER